MNIEHLAQGIVGNSRISKQEGGMINNNYHIESIPDKKSYFLTIYTSKEDWWKAKKNARVGNLLLNAGVPTPKVVKYGLLDNEGVSVTYLLREYICGETYDSLMLSENKLEETDWIKLLSDFGDNLARIHKIGFDSFGMIKGGNITSSPSNRISHSPDWISFFDQLINEKRGRLANIYPEMKIGSVSGVNIHTLFDSIMDYYSIHRNSLLSVTKPYLTHNDLINTNLIASKINEDGNDWMLGGILDTEWSLAGDPDYDLIQIENWVQFAPYRKKFNNYFPYFIDSYQQNRNLSPDLEDKRGIYHIARSISYLTSVFDYDYEVFASSKLHVHQVQEHYAFLHNVVRNNYEFKLFK